jgi:surface antigen
MAKDNWGVELGGWGNAGSWASSAKDKGYAVASFPINGTIATSSGHVAYVISSNGSKVTVSEMNCGFAFKSNRQGSSYTYRSNFFNKGYITPLFVYDFWIKSSSITPTFGATYDNRNCNFDAQFKVVAYTAFPVQKFMMAVHKADSRLTWVRDFVTSSGSTFSASPDVSAGSVFASGIQYTYFNSWEGTSYLNSWEGTYYIIPKVMINDRWVVLGKAKVKVIK